MQNNNTYKIIFNLQTPMSFIDFPTFDGVLSYAYAREISKNKTFVQKLNYDNAELIDFSNMPIIMHKNGYFMASSMFYNSNETIEDTQKWRKRWDCKNDKIADFVKNKRKLEINKGCFKSYDMPISTKLINECWFFFQSENIEYINYLVSKWINFLGKKRSQGYGEVKSFKIESSDFNFNEIFRPIPIKFLNSKFENINVKYCGWRPPYWLPDNFDNCIVLNN